MHHAKVALVRWLALPHLAKLRGLPAVGFERHRDSAVALHVRQEIKGKKEVISNRSQERRNKSEESIWDVGGTHLHVRRVVTGGEQQHLREGDGTLRSEEIGGDGRRSKEMEGERRAVERSSTGIFTRAARSSSVPNPQFDSFLKL